MLNYLKIKCTSLAAEAKLIRKDENKRLQNAANARSKARENIKLTPNVYDKHEEYHLRVYEGLKNHRVKDIRLEARAANVAYGFLKGKKYRDIERISYTQPDWEKVRFLVQSYGEDTDRMDKFEVWLKEALHDESEYPQGGFLPPYSNRPVANKFFMPRSVKLLTSWILGPFKGSWSAWDAHFRTIHPRREKRPYTGQHLGEK